MLKFPQVLIEVGVVKALECQGVLLESELSLKAWASRKFEFKSGNGVIELARYQAPQYSGFRKRKPLLKAQRECPQHKSTERLRTFRKAAGDKIHRAGHSRGLRSDTESVEES